MTRTSSRSLRERLRSKRDPVLIPAASAWEIDHQGPGRTAPPAIDPRAFLRAAIRDRPVAELPISLAHAARVVELLAAPPPSLRPHVVMTVDRAFEVYGVLVVG